MLDSKQQQTINELHDHVKNFLKEDTTGHDFEHIKRVVKLTTRFLTSENHFVALSIAYMHDLFDDKINKVDNIDVEFNKLIKNKWNLDLADSHQAILQGIKSIGFKGGFNKATQSKEASLVSDADYLDAMGAIGIARTFYYAGSKGHPLYKEELKNIEIHNEEDYRNKERNAIAHFDEKLFKLKDLIKNPQAKILAEKRHAYLIEFYNGFMDEIK